MNARLADLAELLATLPDDVRPAGSVQVIDVAAPFEPNPTAPTAVVGWRGGAIELPEVVSRAFRADQPVWLLRAGREPIASMLDRVGASDGTFDVLFVPAVAAEEAERSLAGLRQLVHRLRAPGGCPWDREQTPESLTRFVVEEAYEVVDAICHGSASDVAEELGDLLLQVFLQAEIAEEAGEFALNDVVARISAKLIRRHPHVFADVQVSGAADVEVNWEALKRAETGERVSALDGIPKSLPALMRAAELQKRMRKTGFEWPDKSGAEAKLAEELAELRAAASPAEATAELGDVLFVATALAAWYGADAEEGLRATNAKVEARFRHVEATVRARGQAIGGVPLGELLAIWTAAKALDPRPS